MNRFLRSLWFQTRALFGSRQKQTELDEELQFHLDTRIEDLRANGLNETQARREATLELGGIDQAKEHCRDAWGTRFVQDLFRDLRYSARGLWKDKSFSFAVVITLALCIGANTTVMSALHGLILKPLPVENPDNLVQLFNLTDHREANNPYSHSCWNQYVDLKARNDLFEGIAFRTPTNKLITRLGSSQRLVGQAVTTDFFELMGAQPVLGRFFLPEEGASGADQVMVLSQTSWETEYEGNPNALGQQVTVDDGLVYTIVGVAPRSMEVFDNRARFTIPYIANARAKDRAQSRYNSFSDDLWLRLKSGVTREAALEQIREIERRWFAEEANADALGSYGGYKYWEFNRQHPLEGSLYLLEGGSLLILLVGCFNVMTLVLSRVNQKRHELSVRTALGAGKSSLRRLLLAEGLWLIVAAVSAGLALALGGTHLINEYLEVLSPRTPPLMVNGSVLLVSLILATGVVATMSLLPLEILWRSGLLQRLDSSHRVASAGGLSRKLSNVMIIGQVAIALIMLTGSGLLLRSFQNVMAVDPGFPASQIIQGRFDFDTTKRFYRKRTEAADLKQRIYHAMQEIPGVESVSFCMYNLFSADLRGGNRVGHNVSPEFFTTMGMPILEGRDFLAGDTPKIAIVDELYARRFFPASSAVGAALPQRWNQPADWPIIVGVVGRANLKGLEERDGIPITYSSSPINEGWWEYSILLRTSRPSADTIREMRATLHEIDPRLPLSYARPLDEALDEMLIGRKGVTVMLLSFAGLAVLLSALGIYSVLAYDVQQRRREIGIRSAIGASQGSILSLILRQGSSKAAVGLGLGLVGSFFLTRFLEVRLFDITALDVPTYLIATSGVMLVALLASFIPALRAVRINPVEALKSE